jgi:DNA invertase Pin-like site-specific DNA recombinase
VRVSTEQQASGGHSLEAQQEKIAAYAKLYDLEIVAYEVDAGLSASSLERPGLQRALARLDTFECGTIIVSKLDRLTRSVRDLCILVDNYFRDGTRNLVSLGDQVDTRSASGRMLLNILTSVSQGEREAAAARTATVMTRLRESGKYAGGFPPFGYTVDEDGSLIDNPGERLMIEEARRHRADGASLRAISKLVGLNPRNGKSFSASQIQGML